jgi:hypothetical protein
VSGSRKRAAVALGGGLLPLFCAGSVDPRTASTSGVLPARHLREHIERMRSMVKRMFRRGPRRICF